jgi:Leucine-rich repeat (LRR) protein
MLQPGGLSQLRNLRKLYLNRNGISQLPASFFSQFASREILLKLELRGNHLTDQSLADAGGGDGGPFGPLKSLQELSLETNQLTMVPSAALSAQRNTLTNLNLGLNQACFKRKNQDNFKCWLLKIRDVPVGALNFPQLNSLSLEFNGLTMIVPQAFQQVPHLQYLYLTGNKFPAWSPEMFRFVY